MNKIIRLLVLLIPASIFSQNHYTEGQWEFHEGLKKTRPLWSRSAFSKLPTVWKKNVVEGSKEFKEEVRLRYGLFYSLKFSNDGLPMGMTKTITPTPKGVPGLTVNCLGCHMSRQLGKETYGIPNVFFDYQRLFYDLQEADEEPIKPFFEMNPINNSMVNYSDYMGRIIAFVRDYFPTINMFRLYSVYKDPDAENKTVEKLLSDLPYRELVKTQPWVNLKIKTDTQTRLYVDASYKGSASGTLYALAFTLNPSGADFLNAVKRFEKSAPQFLNQISKVEYPWINQINDEKATRGQALYQNKCAGCHGDYEKRGIRDYKLINYPAKLVERELLKTDTLRIDYKINYESELPNYINKMFVRTGKYLAPPLTSIWARSPYLHNGSVPSLMLLLNSEMRMKTYAYFPDYDNEDNYDKLQLGWKTTSLSHLSFEELKTWKKNNPYARIYDPSLQLGMENSGHTFGDTLTELERSDLIEFLKVL